MNTIFYYAVTIKFSHRLFSSLSDIHITFVFIHVCLKRKVGVLRCWFHRGSVVKPYYLYMCQYITQFSPSNIKKYKIISVKVEWRLKFHLETKNFISS